MLRMLGEDAAAAAEEEVVVVERQAETQRHDAMAVGDLGTIAMVAILVAEDLDYGDILREDNAAEAVIRTSLVCHKGCSVYLHSDGCVGLGATRTSPSLLSRSADQFQTAHLVIYY